MVSHVGKVDIDLRPVCLVALGGWVNEFFFCDLRTILPDQRGNQSLKAARSANFWNFEASVTEKC